MKEMEREEKWKGNQLVQKLGALESIYKKFNVILM